MTTPCRGLLLVRLLRLHFNPRCGLASDRMGEGGLEAISDRPFLFGDLPDYKTARQRLLYLAATTQISRRPFHPPPPPQGRQAGGKMQGCRLSSASGTDRRSLPARLGPSTSVSRDLTLWGACLALQPLEHTRKAFVECGSALLSGSVPPLRGCRHTVRGTRCTFECFFF